VDKRFGNTASWLQLKSNSSHRARDTRVGVVSPAAGYRSAQRHGDRAFFADD